MGQKTHPKGFRLGVVESWDSTWFANDKQFGSYLVEDVRVRRFVRYEVGEGLEKRADDFAAEVKKQAGQA